MTKDDIAHLASSVGMVQTGGDLLKPMWLASDAQIAKMLEVVIADVKQSASEVMVKAIKKAAEYERGECAKIADRKSTRLNSSHSQQSRMPSSA